MAMVEAELLASTAIVFFFFFQAEDGIRDLTVTGVQTCALPISRRRFQPPAEGRADGFFRSAGGGAVFAVVECGGSTPLWIFWLGGTGKRIQIGRASCRGRV